PGDALDRACEPAGHIDGSERAMGTGIPGDQRLERMSDRLGERQGQTERHVAAESIAIARRVFHADEPRLARELDLDDPPGVDETVDPLGGGTVAPQI